jgi:hypothetical protein
LLLAALMRGSPRRILTGFMRALFLCGKAPLDRNQVLCYNVVVLIEAGRKTGYLTIVLEGCII